MSPLVLESLHPNELSFESKASGLPFVVRANTSPGTTRAHVMAYFREHAEPVRQLVRRNGVILLRGLPIETPQDLQDALEALGYNLYATNYGGASPRANITQKTFESTAAPAPFIIGFHTEFCYQSTRPGMIAFFCMQPARRYGETPLFDCSLVWESLSPALRDMLETRGLLYRRYFYNRRSALNFRKTWSEAFQTTNRDEVEAYLDSEGMRYQWESNGNLATELRLPAMVVDPVHRKKRLSITLFNADSFRYMFRHFRDRYHPIQRAALELFVRWEYAKKNTFLQVLWGNGQAFSREETEEIQRAAWENAIAFPWQPRDLLLIDNVCFGHSRLNVENPRRVIAAMADPYDVRAYRAAGDSAAEQMAMGCGASVC